ncbi:alpha-1,2-fucosyltransferase [Microbacterium marinum]|uniref:alpha-1,2-fucosyltransferase n=1 Tax=Microbacterium marinum TaxID=421115 RepID=UPI00384FC669
MKAFSLLRRVGRHAAWRMRRLVARTADKFRRGERTVIATPPAGLRFGNWLYLWLDAHRRTLDGHPTFVLEVSGMAPWLEAFPRLRAYTVAADSVKFHDHREWGEFSWNQRYGQDFVRADLVAFINDVLVAEIQPDDSSAVVVNVRRGDYYSNPGLKERYGFDQIGYLREALTRVGDVDVVTIVSDDVPWCRMHVAPLLPSEAVVKFAAQDPVGDFLTVARSRRIIGMNSTFTYWGAYIATVLHPDACIVMPQFHARMAGSWDAHQLDPDWIILDGFA